jgi:hypothetical protein
MKSFVLQSGRLGRLVGRSVGSAQEEILLTDAKCMMKYMDLRKLKCQSAVMTTFFYSSFEGRRTGRYGI